MADGDGQTGPEDRGANVGVPVVIVPGFFVTVPAMLRGDSLERRLEIMLDEPRLVFGCGDRGGGSDDKHGSDATIDRSFSKTSSDLVSEVTHLIAAVRADRELVCFGAHTDKSTH